MGHIKHKAQAGMFVAALLAAVLALPGAAFGLSTDKATAKPNEDGGSGVIGGMNTRLTWEGTVDDGESVDAVTLELPEGATFDGSSTRITVLEGLNRVKIDGQAVAPKSYNVDPELFHSGTALQSGKKHWAKLV